MRRTLSCVVLLALAVPCSAQGEKAKPNTLTPKEIADGWILLFDGETTFGWTVTYSSNKTQALVKDGMLDLSGQGESTIDLSLGLPECVLVFEYIRTGKDGSVTLRNGEGQVLPKSSDWQSASLTVASDNVLVEIGTYKASLQRTNPTKIQFSQLKDSSLKLRNIKLRPRNTTPLYNGKDLAGWKTFPGDKYKSRFTVNDQGELNVKDGPGDLQTVGKYKDFVLQLECISNGKHLNSGIFFRCRDNEYQNGYEAQIRNQFTKEPTQKYLIESYDPKTNKLVGKSEMQSTAVDFGTGAIYRRVPARKEMSKDGEWFSMTIAARGNHFATWVNGVQVTDWTDHRPKSDNARTGCRLEAGHLSIQGHDPTTDLSFRNLRIAEMK